MHSSPRKEVQAVYAQEKRARGGSVYGVYWCLCEVSWFRSCYFLYRFSLLPLLLWTERLFLIAHSARLRARAAFATSSSSGKISSTLPSRFPRWSRPSCSYTPGCCIFPRQQNKITSKKRTVYSGKYSWVLFSSLAHGQAYGHG